MRRTWRNKSKKEWEAGVWHQFLENLSTKEKVGFKSTLNSLLTDYEKSTIVARLAAIELIKSGHTYKEIGDILWLSPTTINTIKKSLMNKSNYKSYRAMYKKPKEYSQNIKTPKADLNLVDFLTNPPRPPGMGLKDSWDPNYRENKRKRVK